MADASLPPHGPAPWKAIDGEEDALAISASAPDIPDLASMFNFVWAPLGVSSGDTEIDVQIRCPETSR